ncbi:DUF982 domain-containing protein [Sinorhizobium meliloti]|nr:hypothetical protein [Sinorhizobium meliloti]
MVGICLGERARIAFIAAINEAKIDLLA